jgi:hypothetical protein
MMRGTIRDSSGKMPHQTSAAPPAQQERKPGTLPEQQSLVMPICRPPCDTPGIQQPRLIITAWVNYAVTHHNTPSEEWCALRELRVDGQGQGRTLTTMRTRGWCQT